jgi:hypothetical protein
LQLFAAIGVVTLMKGFLKIVLLVVVALMAVKLLPLTFAVGCLLAAAVLGLVAFGVSVVAVLFGAFVVVAAALAPIWIPVLAVVGLISLMKRPSGSSPSLAP